MSNKSRYYISKKVGIVDREGRPSSPMAMWMDRISVISDGIARFIGTDGSGSITADEVNQGITRRVREIAAKEYSYNGDGTVSQVVYKDPDTAATIATEAFTYNGDGTVATATETTDVATIIEAYNYDPSQLISDIGVSIA